MYQDSGGTTIKNLNYYNLEKVYKSKFYRYITLHGHILPQEINWKIVT